MSRVVSSTGPRVTIPIGDSTGYVTHRRSVIYQAFGASMRDSDVRNYPSLTTHSGPVAERVVVREASAEWVPALGPHRVPRACAADVRFHESATVKFHQTLHSSNS